MICCGNCQHWIADAALPHGLCVKIAQPENSSAIVTRTSDDHWMLDDGDEDDAAEFAAREADRAKLAVLSLCCCGTLRTRAEFSCALHEPKDTVAS